MIGNLKAPFFKSDKIFDETQMLYIKLHLLDDERIVDKLPAYQSGDIFAFFTDKRIVFTSSPDTFGDFDSSYEIEFLPYKSIQRFTFLESSTQRKYKLDIVISDNTAFSVFLTSLDDAMKISILMGKNNL